MGDSSHLIQSPLQIATLILSNTTLINSNSINIASHQHIYLLDSITLPSFSHLPQHIGSCPRLTSDLPIFLLLHFLLIHFLNESNYPKNLSSCILLFVFNMLKCVVYSLPAFFNHYAARILYIMLLMNIKQRVLILFYRGVGWGGWRRL